MHNIDQALKSSVKSKDVGQIQLISHQRAYIYLQCGEYEKVCLCPVWCPFILASKHVHVSGSGDWGEGAEVPEG